MPALRRRQARRFPSTNPHLPLVRFSWSDAAPDDETFAVLKMLAADTAYVGHSSSLTRCHFRCVEDTAAPKQAMSPRRRIYRGRFAELRTSYQSFVSSNGKRGRPLPGAQVKPERQASAVLPHAFNDRWLLLEHVSGAMPDTRASGVVCKVIRDTLLSAYKRIGLEDRIPEMVSGHAQNGEPSRTPHVAIVPLTFTGFPHADGHVMGFALVPPRDSEILDDDDFRRALRTVAPLDENIGRRRITIKSKISTPHEGTFSVDLSPTFEAPADKRSLDPAIYTRAARAFATVTPIVLDRHLKEKGEAQIEEIVAQIIAGCRNIGLPEPETVIPDKHSAIEGAPSASPSGKAPDWMHWRLPAALRTRQLTHAVIRFSEPVQGPLLLCAGRFIGLGLCRPLIRSEEEE